MAIHQIIIGKEALAKAAAMALESGKSIFLADIPAGSVLMECRPFEDGSVMISYSLDGNEPGPSVSIGIGRA